LLMDGLNRLGDSCFYEFGLKISAVTRRKERGEEQYY